MHFFQSKSTKCQIVAVSLTPLTKTWKNVNLHRKKQAILMHFSQSKSTKCEIFAWNCDFLGTAYHGDSKHVTLVLACLKLSICTTQAFSMHCSQSKSINKMWNFGCFLNSPWQKIEKMPICTGKKCLKRLANLHI